ncbi:nicotinamide riboside transporter PnuC [Abiotrophia defectiva]|jgi:nicotinamide mononucleotide transporter pnuC|uniref:nicotinamide riboside transporter PnuC n=1 Tax=Abiotrophia defectiva TaxID=46125 RepID=UPI0028D03916|nr:nicotinamide riboside transporter PnuC [Abiotrophia defectiva]
MSIVENFKTKWNKIHEYCTSGYKVTGRNLKVLAGDTKKLGFAGVVKAIYEDLVVGRTQLEWAYLIIMSIVPIIVSLFASDSTLPGFIAAFTGVINVILVAEGRKSNYFFGVISTSIYLVLSIQKAFYGEVLTNVYFVIMQPIGLYVWLMADRKRQEETHQVEDSPTNVKARRMGLVDWIIAIAQAIIIWLTMGLIYQLIGSNRSFRDSVTDGTNVVGQKLMTELYVEQWVFWIATNLFSIYLWWAENQSIDIVVMYLLFTVNSIVGMYRWIQQAQANQ